MYVIEQRWKNGSVRKVSYPTIRKLQISLASIRKAHKDSELFYDQERVWNLHRMMFVYRAWGENPSYQHWLMFGVGTNFAVYAYFEDQSGQSLRLDYAIMVYRDSENNFLVSIKDKNSDVTYKSLPEKFYSGIERFMRDTITRLEE